MSGIGCLVEGYSSDRELWRKWNITYNGEVREGYVSPHREREEFKSSIALERNLELQILQKNTIISPIPVVLFLVV